MPPTLPRRPSSVATRRRAWLQEVKILVCVSVLACTLVRQLGRRGGGGGVALGSDAAASSQVSRGHHHRPHHAYREDSLDEAVLRRALDQGLPSFRRTLEEYKRMFNASEEAREEVMRQVQTPPIDRVGLQSVSEYAEVSLVSITPNKKLYIIPVPPTEEQDENKHMMLQLDLLAMFVSSFFQVPCQVLEPMNKTALECDTYIRRHMEYPDYFEQYAPDLVRHNKDRMPQDALGLIIVTSAALYTHRERRDRSSSYVSPDEPIVCVAMDERIEDTRETFCAMARGIVALLGFQLPCRWFDGCIFSGDEPEIDDKPDPFADDSEGDEEHTRWLDETGYDKKDDAPIGPSVFENTLLPCPVCLQKMSLLPSSFDHLRHAKLLLALYTWIYETNHSFQRELVKLRRLIEVLEGGDVDLNAIAMEGMRTLRLPQTEPELKPSGDDDMQLAEERLASMRSSGADHVGT